jgi:hypothetical protein
MSDEQVQKAKETLLEAVADTLIDVMQGAPHLIVDSGWGWHFHYAVAEDYRMEKDALKRLHIMVVNEVNHLINGTSDLDWPKAFDATNDVGSRICRKVGSWNRKQADRPLQCTVFSEAPDAPLIDSERYDRITDALPVRTSAPPPSQAASGATSSRSSARSSSRQYLDFRDQDWPEGGCWQDIVDSMVEGSRENVVCPFAGTSEGSGFFVKEQDGRSRFVSNAQSITYINTYRPNTTGITPMVASASGGSGGSQNPPPPPPPSGGNQGGSGGQQGGRNPNQRAVLTPRLDNEGNDTGQPEATTGNLLRVLMQDGRLDLWFDEFRQVCMNGTSEITDTIYIDLLLMLESDYNWRRGIPSKDKIWIAIQRVCEAQSRNPVADFLNGLQWDGVDRVEGWIQRAIINPCTAAGCKVDSLKLPLYRAYAKKWAISLVARALDPGCKVDTVLILSGRQGFRKSTLFEAWCPFPDLFVDTKLDMRSNDKYLTIHRSWIFEDAEMASGTRSTQEVMKNFLSSREDTFRSPYARTLKTVKRKCVVVGTTNDASILKDNTGSRRYWIVDIPEKIGVDKFHPSQPVADLAWIKANRDQLLAEAVHLFRSGEQWHLTPDEDADRDQANAKHRMENVWEEYAHLAFAHSFGGLKNAFSISDFVHAIDDEMKHKEVAKLGYTLSNALIGAGFKKHNKKYRGRTVYYKPVPSGVSTLKGDGLDKVREAAQGWPEKPSAGNWSFNTDFRP